MMGSARLFKEIYNKIISLETNFKIKISIKS